MCNRVKTGIQDSDHVIAKYNNYVNDTLYKCINSHPLARVMVGVAGVEGGCTVCPLHQTHHEQRTQAGKGEGRQINHVQKHSLFH